MFSKINLALGTALVGIALFCFVDPSLAQEAVALRLPPTTMMKSILMTTATINRGGGGHAQVAALQKRTTRRGRMWVKTGRWQ